MEIVTKASHTLKGWNGEVGEQVFIHAEKEISDNVFVACEPSLCTSAQSYVSIRGQ